MIRSSRIGLLLLGSLLIFCSCSNDEIGPDEDRVGFSYYPLKVGDWRIYQVNQSDYRIIGDTIEKAFLLREEIVDAFLNAEGDSTYVLHRSVFNTVSDQFELDSVWSVRRTSNHVIVVENNTPYVKLGFPIKDGLSWDGNVLNTLDEETFTMDELGEELTVGDMIFENTLRVVESDIRDTIIRFDQRYDYYSLRVGLVKKRSLILNYCSTVDCLGQGIVESGLDYEQEIVDYGPK